MDLRPDQELLLEIDEDHAVVSGQRADNTQIKFSDAAQGARAVSLRSAGVVQAIARYWDQSRQGDDPRPNLRFLTNSRAAREQGTTFPDNTAGLIYWKQAASGADPSPLRPLLDELFANTALGAWLRSNPSDVDLRTRLLGRIEFVLGAPDDMALRSHIRERLGMIYLGKGHFETAAESGLSVLLDQVFSAASAKDPTARRLTVGDLHRAIEETIPRMGALTQAQLIQHARPETGIGVTALQLRSGLSERADTVAGLLASLDREGVAWLYGPNGVGKSTLAKLIARSEGGSWLVCDFRPFLADADSRGAVALWRELMSALADGGSPDGIILDDISARGIDLLKSRLAGLAVATRIRGARIIITSNHIPSSALLAEIGASPRAAVEAPYFSVTDVRELVETATPPSAELVEGWSNLVHISTAGGHPLLVTAKIANLRVRGWPKEGLLEDLGQQTNEGVKGSKFEARKRLLEEIPSNTSARAVLERVSTVFQGFDDGLVRALSCDPPEVERPSDALTLLKGTWLEPVAGIGWRLSPLLTDLAADVSPEQARRWRQIAAVYWLSKKTLNARTLPLCFWNAYLGKHPVVLLKVTEAIMTLEPGQVQSAAAMLTPLTAFHTDRSLFSEEPMTACGLRMLQILVADAVEDERVAGAAAATLLSEIDALPDPRLCDLETSLSAKVVLGVERVWIPARLQLTYLRRLKDMTARVMAGSFPDLKVSLQGLNDGLPAGADACGMHLASVFMRMRNSKHLCEMIDALAELNEDERASLIRSVEAVLQDLGTFVHNAWANEQVNGGDLQATLGFYNRMRTRVANWNMPHLEAELAIAQSVILDEGLEDRAKSLEVIDVAIVKFGTLPALIRQKSKVLRHQGANEAAANALIEIEDDIAKLPPFDQGLALRDGAVAAFHANRFIDALRLFGKASSVFAAKGGSEAMCVGLTVDEAMVLWELGQREEAIRRAGDALEAVEKINPSASRQSLRAHRMARAVVGLFMHLVEPYPKGPRPPLTAGMGSVLEGSDAPGPADLKELSDNWRILELVECDAGVDAGIAARSATRQGKSRLVSIESLLAKAHFARALEAGDIDGAVRAILPAVSLAQRFKATLTCEGADRTTLVSADVGSLVRFGVDDLVSLGWHEALQAALVDVMMALALRDRWTPKAAQRLQDSVLQHWKDTKLLKPLLDAASGAPPPHDTAEMPILTAFSLKTIADDKALSHAERFSRDLYWLYQAANSLARRALEPLVVKAVADGWRYVLDHQRFSLSMPMRTGPALAAAIDAMEKQGIRAMPQLLEAAANAAKLVVPSQWEAFLAALRDA
ncbi:MAG: ATP-binding protein [Hyphomicrobiaceae bacterium]